MKWTLAVVVSIGVIMPSLAGNHAWAQGSGNAEAGLTLARQICSGCHAVERAQASSPNAAAPRFETIAAVPGMTSTALAVALRTSHQTMPNIMLNAGELSDITAYILSLQRAN